MAASMTVLVCPHDLTFGGSQINAIELAGVARDLGHRVTIAGPQGPLAEKVRNLDLPFRELPTPSFPGGAAYVRALSRMIDDVHPDIVHAYESTVITLAWCGVHLRTGIPLLGTVNSMSVAPFLPPAIPLLVCTPLIASQQAGRASVDVLEIPTDLEANDAAFDGSEFRRNQGLADEDIAVVLVGRLAPDLKREGILTAIECVGALPAEHRVRLFVVGDGPVRAEVEAARDKANASAGREAVTLTGELFDPRPAYAGADVSLGMGGSLLRAMAFRKPCIVQGEGGFWCALTPESAGQFRWRGYYGIDSRTDGAVALREELMSLVTDPQRRATLGDYSLRLVKAHYDLRNVGAIQVEHYRRAASAPRRRSSDAWSTTEAFSRSALRMARRAVTGERNANGSNAREAIEDGIVAPIPPEYQAPYPLHEAEPLR